MVSSYPIFTSFPRVDGWSTDPQVLGRHKTNKFSLNIFITKALLVIKILHIEIGLFKLSIKL